jgi:phosphoenolpyruvate carboxykinase (GTP)
MGFLRFQDWSQHNRLIGWIEEMKRLCTPQSVHLCDGSQEEYEQLCRLLVDEAVFTPLNPITRPGSFWCASDPADVARVEERTFICSQLQKDAGPTNNWKDPEEMKKILKDLFQGCMQGRVMYVVPFSMGPYGSKLSLIGVQITDSPYAVVNMHIMTRMGLRALEELGTQGEFVPGIHSVGSPLKSGEKDRVWPCAEHKYIVHFPEERSIWSYGSGYGGNALLGKKCLALRIASAKGRDEGWLAEHMLILGMTNPEGEKKYFAAAFPSACGKTNLAMMTPSIPGWKIECVGDDIAWMRFGSDGRLYAINPENGFFGVAPGTSMQSNPNAMQTIMRNTIYTNVALTSDYDVWWEGMTEKPPEQLTSWKRVPWTPESKEPAAHPNSRFTVPARQCPIMSSSMEDPAGVPISGIIFGGRRASLEPLVYEAFDWDHGVFLGAALSSEMTAAAKGVLGQLRHDPFAMLPFCGYNMGDYFAHWLKMGKKTRPDLLPKIFHVNWFKKGEDGKFLWPGYGENARVLKWMFERVSHAAEAETTPIGRIPKQGGIDLTGIPQVADNLKQLFAIDRSEWRKEVEDIRHYFKLFGEQLPEDIRKQLNALEDRLTYRESSCTKS